jgi:hypothetical protein
VARSRHRDALARPLRSIGVAGRETRVEQKTSLRWERIFGLSPRAVKAILMAVARRRAEFSCQRFKEADAPAAANALQNRNPCADVLWVRELL